MIRHDPRGPVTPVHSPAQVAVFQALAAALTGDDDCVCATQCIASGGGCMCWPQTAPTT